MNLRELEGRVAIVTGAGRNIGRAIALDLAEGGACVAVMVRSDMKSAEAVVKDIEARAAEGLVIRADVSEPADIKRMVGETLARFGRRDILVNNASVRPEAPIEDITLESWRDVMHVSLEGPFLCVQAASASAHENQGHDRQYRRPYRLCGGPASGPCGRRQSRA
jgi:3-oxoacyl-[acyl-carrier protein] reductase